MALGWRRWRRAAIGMGVGALPRLTDGHGETKGAAGADGVARDGSTGVVPGVPSASDVGGVASRPRGAQLAAISGGSGVGPVPRLGAVTVHSDVAQGSGRWHGETTLRCAG